MSIRTLIARDKPPDMSNCKIILNKKPSKNKLKINYEVIINASLKKLLKKFISKRMGIKAVGWNGLKFNRYRIKSKILNAMEKNRSDYIRSDYINIAQMDLLFSKDIIDSGKFSFETDYFGMVESIGSYLQDAMNTLKEGIKELYNPKPKSKLRLTDNWGTPSWRYRELGSE